MHCWGPSWLHAHAPHSATCSAALEDVSPLAHSTGDKRSTALPCPLSTKYPEGKARPACKAKDRWLPFLENRRVQLSANVGTYQVDVALNSLADSSLGGFGSHRTFPPALLLALRSHLDLLAPRHLCITLSLNVAFPAFLPSPCLFIHSFLLITLHWLLPTCILRIATWSGGLGSTLHITAALILRPCR